MIDLKLFETYDDFVHTTAIFKADRGIQYCITKLAGEVGEFNQKLAEEVTSQPGFTDHYFREWMRDGRRADMILELGDIVWYVAALSQQLGYNITLLRGMHPNRQYRVRDGIGVLTFGLLLSSEVGAISERAGKIIRDKGGDGTNTSFNASFDFQKQTMRNLAEILDHVECVAAYFNASLEYVIERNVAKLESRRNRGVLSGSGDNR